MRSWSDGGKRLLGAGKFSKRPLVRLHLRSLQGGKEKANNFTVLSQRQLIPVIPSGRVGTGAAPDERARHGRGTSWLFPFGLIPTSCLPSTHPPHPLMGYQTPRCTEKSESKTKLILGIP